MTNQELVYELQKLPPNMEVVIQQVNQDFVSMQIQSVHAEERNFTDVDDPSLKWTEEVVVITDEF